MIANKFWIGRIMALLLALLELALAALVIFFALRSFHARRTTVGWWVVLITSMAIGGLAGAWLGFRFSYQITPEIVVYSFPVPGAFHALESYDDGTKQWVGFTTAAPLAVAVANAFGVLSAAVGAVWVVNSLTRPRPNTNLDATD